MMACICDRVRDAECVLVNGGGDADVYIDVAGDLPWAYEYCS